MTDKKKTVSLVLGSGGARGLAHIGIIGWLEENGYSIRSISGCSMGALVGGIYACGKLDTYTAWVRAIDKLDIVRLLDISWGKGGLVEGEKIIATLKDLIGDRRIEDLPIKFTAVAADIGREKEVWITLSVRGYPGVDLDAAFLHAGRALRHDPARRRHTESGPHRTDLRGPDRPDDRGQPRRAARAEAAPTTGARSGPSRDQ